MSTYAWLLTAHLTLSTGEPVDVLHSLHHTEAACIAAIPAPRKGQRGRRYDCTPMSRPSVNGRGFQDQLDLMDLEKARNERPMEWPQ